jgi:hypothetical protein
MINVRIIKEHQLVVMCFEGDITPGDVTAFIAGLVKKSGYDPAYSTIVDLRNCTLLYDVGALKQTIQYMATAEGFAAKRKTAYITSSSGHVVPPMMMTSGTYNIPMEVKVHSTVEAALSWLGLEDFTPEDYQQVLRSMCNCC